MSCVYTVEANKLRTRNALDVYTEIDCALARATTCKIVFTPTANAR